MLLLCEKHNLNVNAHSKSLPELVMSLTILTGVRLCTSFIVHLVQGSMLTVRALTVGTTCKPSRFTSIFSFHKAPSSFKTLKVSLLQLTIHLLQIVIRCSKPLPVVGLFFLMLFWLCAERANSNDHPDHPGQEPSVFSHANMPLAAAAFDWKRRQQISPGLMSFGYAQISD